MRINLQIISNLKTKEVQTKVKSAAKKSLVDTVVAIANDAIKLSPKLTGNNARSIKFEVGPNGEVARKDLEAAVYSTSGYGGYLETGTVNMVEQPYFKPALDKNIHKLPRGIKARLS